MYGQLLFDNANHVPGYNNILVPVRTRAREHFIKLTTTLGYRATVLLSNLYLTSYRVDASFDTPLGVGNAPFIRSFFDQCEDFIIQLNVDRSLAS